MEDLRRWKPLPFFNYGGHLLSAFLYYKGNSDLVHSFDVVIRGANLSKMDVTQREEEYGLTEQDMNDINIYVQRKIDYMEGRI